MQPVSSFWWSPNQDRRLLIKELRRDFLAWQRLSLRHRRLPLNFGDEITPLVVSHVTGRNVVWEPARSARLIAVGSIIEFVEARSAVRPLVWGTGLRKMPESTARAEALRGAFTEFLAVRGPMTRDALGLDPSTVLGDPGVLVAEALPRENASRSGAIYIPHFRTWATREGLDHLRQVAAKGVRIVPPALPARNVLRDIAASDYVLSSSLHGVIAAHAYGVPVTWVGISGENGREPLFKFEDYFRSLDCMPVPRPIAPEALSNAPLEHREFSDQYAAAAEEATSRLSSSLRSALAAGLSDV